MKELSIEEKAKAYDEAKIRGSRLWESGTITRENYEYIFPEIAESEDERITQELISFVRGMLACHDKPNAERDEKYESWIAWLEKQGEIVAYYEDILDECACKYFNKGYKHAIKMQGEQKNDWSEEDEQILNAAILHIKNETYNYYGRYSSEDIMQWFKSLKNRVQS